jgi:3-isopropylmalate dehydratase small subunit
MGVGVDLVISFLYKKIFIRNYFEQGIFFFVNIIASIDTLLNNSIPGDHFVSSLFALFWNIVQSSG